MSNDEYQQQQFWDQKESWMEDTIRLVMYRMERELEKQFLESHDYLMKQLRTK